MDPSVVFVVAWLLATPVLFILWVLTWHRLRKARKQVGSIREEQNAVIDQWNEKYGDLISEDNALKRLRNEIAAEQVKVEELRKSYSEKKPIYDQLKHELAIYDERLGFAELGVYEPHFEFKDSEIYKEQIRAIRDRQKMMVSQKTACLCPTSWTVDGSLSKGQTMINRQMRLTMRAFNNECEAAIANTRWNNVVVMENRVLRAAKAINAANSSMKLELSDSYIALKIDELHLTHEYRERLKVERDERSELARAEREEKKLIADAERAEREEQRFQAMLTKVRKEAGLDLDNEALRKRIEELEASVAEAHAAGERARAMAEMTKSGYVYIISNVGSFGDDVIKIGLTRRLEPDDRVRELGDASVPFSFDTHAMIYSEEAPALEAALHREFFERRINMTNTRKEFFRVSLDEVEEAVKRLAPDASFFKDREAQEWHETLARRKELLNELSEKSGIGELPDSI